MIKTKIVTNDLEEAAALLRQGKLVAVPTETVYGLAGNGLDEQAVEAIYEVKGRPQVKPLSLMVPDESAMERYCEAVPEQARFLAERFWPGPLTIVLKAKPLVPTIVRAGGETVGLRCPDHPMTLALLRMAEIPFAAPSANPSGEPSPKTAQQVQRYFDGKIAAIVDGGACGIGTESTLLDMSRTPYRILRQGALAADVIGDALAEHLTLVGITGGSGSGKTTALRELEKRGALVIDCDTVYHTLLEESEALIEELDESFPGTVENGKLQRRKLGAVVFENPEALRRLNEITHRHITRRVRQLLRAHAMNGGTLAAIDAVELIGSGLGEKCAFTLGILADRETRIRRIVARDGLTPEYAAARIDAQRPDSYFREHCTVCLENNGEEQTFQNQINQILEERLNHG